MPAERQALRIRIWGRFLAVLLWVAASAAPAAADAPYWLAAGEGGRGRTIERTFSVEQAARSARLKAAADFCSVAVTINGERALTIEPYSQTVELDVTNLVRRGANKIAIETAPVDGPAAVAISLEVEGVDGKKTVLATDGAWRNGASRGLVAPELWGLTGRSAAVSPFDNYEQWQQAKGDRPAAPPRFWAAPGFEISLVRRAEPNEGSWIALAFDAQGRATISREDTGLLRFTLGKDWQSVERVEHVDAPLPECRGLLYVDDWLYANANNAKTLYRLKLDDEGRAANLEKLREFPGGVGHGRNDLALGPDGLLYSIHGDSVEAPAGPLVDRTSPLRESRVGRARQEGYVTRADREGSRWELLCTGLRNPYGLAFHPNGDLFTYDADNEYDMGAPWYRPTRIVQLLSGADYGWRVAQGRWPPSYPDRPDNALPTIDVGRGSPTAVMFGAHLNFPPAYQDALFVLDWAYGRVLAVHLAPRGAGYRAALELFLQGKPLNVTDVAAGPDRSMWLITGGRKTQSALYRVTFSGAEDRPLRPALHEREAAEYSNGQRVLRQALEALHGQPDAKAFAVARPYLASADPIIRHAARIALEQQPRAEVAAWCERALEANFAGKDAASTAASLECLLMLARAQAPAAVPAMLERLLQMPAERLSLSGRLQVVHLHRECLTRNPEATRAERERIARQLDSFWPVLPREGQSVSPLGDSAELRRRVALLWADLADAKGVERICRSLLASPVQEDRLQGLLALRGATEGWQADTRRIYFAALRDASRFVGGEGMPTFIERLRADATASLADDDRTRLADLLTPLAPADEPLPPARPKVRAWSLEDLASLTTDEAAPGNAERGAKVFQEALCSRCHRAGLSGPAVGPDLTFVARRFSRKDLLESILLPAKSVAENYRNVAVVTNSGEVHVGRLLSEGDFRSEKLRLNVDSLRPGRIVEIDKKEVAEQRAHESSPMPTGLLDSFTKDEIADLLAYLESGGSR